MGTESDPQNMHRLFFKKVLGATILQKRYFLQQLQQVCWPRKFKSVYQCYPSNIMVLAPRGVGILGWKKILFHNMVELKF